MSSKPPITATTPSLVVLPVLAGHTRDFDGLVRRVREFIEYRETSAGPWLFRPEPGVRSIWQWVARNGVGDSCRDMRILDEFVELVFAYDQRTGTVGVIPWRPSSRSMLTSDSVFLNQTLAFIGAHLESPQQFAFYSTPKIEGRDAETGFVRRGSSSDGGDFSANIYSLAAYATVEAVLPDDDDDDDEDAWLVDVPDLDSSYYVADWLDVLLYEPYPEDQMRWLEEHPITTADDVWERIAELHADYFETDWRRGRTFEMTIAALFARVLERTAELRGLYRHFAEVWPELPTLRLGTPVASVTFCVTHPELACEVAALACDFCEGCARERDVTDHHQLELELAG